MKFFGGVSGVVVVMSEKKEREEEENADNNRKKAKTVDPEIQKAGERHVEILLNDLLNGEIPDHEVDDWFTDVVVVLIDVFKVDRNKVNYILKPYVLSFIEKNELSDGNFVRRIKTLKNYL